MHFPTIPTDPAGAKSANEAIIELAKKNNFGQQTNHSLETGLQDYSRRFAQENLSFGLYQINGHDFYFINEHKLNDEERSLLSKVRTKKTDAPGVLALSVGKCCLIRKEFEPVYQAPKRDHEEN